MKLIHYLEPKGGAVGKEHFFLAVYTNMGLGEADVKKHLSYTEVVKDGLAMGRGC